MIHSEERLAAATLRFDQKVQEIVSAQAAKFVEIDISNWHSIYVKSMAEPTPLYSAATPLREWGHEWWLKVEKSLDGRVGLYLCCGSDDPAGNTTTGGGSGANAPAVAATTPGVSVGGAPTSTGGPNNTTGRWPVTCDYQLMARRRNTDDAVCCSVNHYDAHH
jgi:hypothetical protein